MENDKNITEDDFDTMKIDQLHKVVMNFSSQSIEIKKMCITVEVAALTLITTIFKGNYSEPSFTISTLLILFLVPILFYGIDIYTYYYQDKLRGVMLESENNIRKRNKLDTRREKRFDRNNKKRIRRAIKSYSNMIYWALLIIAFIGLFIVLFRLKCL
ncbi:MULTISPECIES: ABC transporter ATP-binding protein [Bacillus cereus group]|uniref:ABC transporter ATP-binding protein n=2 Tax=Bacillus TaxID=1386 RepID=UPI000BFB8055|nr:MULTISPECIES: ABC transporter ATP-binding protein [Bacillus cereus group]MCU5474216.1 ABC transporter ATP-binding protein [Bacillus cereus]MCU5613472.1 ABC transporter ATP-binding protein [Bacillus cereus]MDA1826515.1 ABC transporter ATP-binding protein [Bacillus cereus group sp. BY25LC]PGM73491.1 hypothetical protein CN952_09150 [Bacillus cereus]PGN14969.1 hypothetical protein CN954_06175 [Bacillus cereus]